MIGRGGSDFGEGFPVIGVEWIEGVDEEFLEAGFTDEFDWFFGALGLESVVVVPERFAQFGKGFGEFGEGRSLTRESGEGWPLACRGREGREASLGVVAGASGTGGPGGSAFGVEFVIEAVFPPTGPEVLKPFARFRWGGFVEGGREKSGGPEDDRFAIFGRMLGQF